MRLFNRLLISFLFLIFALYFFVLLGLPLVGIYVYFPFPIFRNLSLNPYSSWNLIILINIVPFIGIALSYLLYIIYAIISLYLPNLPFSKKFLKIYSQFELVHKISILVSIPFLFPIGFFMFTAFFFQANITFSPMQIVLGILIWIIWFRYSRNIFSRVAGIMALSLAIFGIFFFMTESVGKFSPAVYGQFPLHDTKGIYLINYDGDYWLTYYLQEQYCWNKNDQEGNLEKVCKINLVKKGNTAIVESPVDLKQYLDKPIVVQGSFVPVIPPISPDNAYREFCVTKKTKVCTESKGAGIWYYSPIKINSIKIK